MTSRDLVAALRARWAVLAAAAVLAALAAYAYTKAPWVEPRWQSTVMVEASGILDYGNTLAVQNELRPLAEEVRQLDLMRQVNQDLHTDLPPEAILAETQATPVQDVNQIQIVVTDPSPQRAEALAVDIARRYTEQHNAVEEGILRERRIELSTLDRPSTAVLIWPQTRILVPAAALLGLLVAALVVLLLRYLDNTILSPADVASFLDLPVIAIIPRTAAPRGGHGGAGTRAPAAHPSMPPAPAQPPTAASTR